MPWLWLVLILAAFLAPEAFLLVLLALVVLFVVSCCG
jgi:hypothetical protein